jgi:3-oxoacyl-[acyl-carrier-protein] synthase II
MRSNPNRPLPLSLSPDRPYHLPMPARVVITGLGPVCSIGVGIEPFWEALLEGRSALSPIEAFDASGYRAKLAGEVREIKIRDFVPKSYRKATKVMARDTELAVIAAKLAAGDAGLVTRGSEDADEGFAPDLTRVGCQIGAGLIAADTEELSRAVVSAKDDDGAFSMEKWGTESTDRVEGASGMNNLPPLWLLKYLPNMLACHVTIIHGLEGPSNTIMGAEASAILSIGESTRVIERGSADMCFTGGAESRLNPLGLLRWDYSGRLADTGEAENGSQITRPFAPDSLGGVIGEAGGMIVIENETHAQDRNATIYATISGFSAAQTPPAGLLGLNHGDEPEPDSPIDRGLEAAIESALADAQISPDQIDLIIPLGLGVANLDAMEIGALHEIFADRLRKIPLLPVAHLVGNTMAGHGGLLASAGAKCIAEQSLPPHLMIEPQTGGFKAQSHPSRAHIIEHVLVCSGSLGGQTGALVLSRYTSKSE